LVEHEIRQIGTREFRHKGARSNVWAVPVASCTRPIRQCRRTNERPLQFSGADHALLHFMIGDFAASKRTRDYAKQETGLMPCLVDADARQIDDPRGAALRHGGDDVSDAIDHNRIVSESAEGPKRAHDDIRSRYGSCDGGSITDVTLKESKRRMSDLELARRANERRYLVPAFKRLSDQQPAGRSRCAKYQKPQWLTPIRPACVQRVGPPGSA